LGQSNTLSRAKNAFRMSQSPHGNSPTPFDEMAGEAPVRALVERFYDAMDEHEPALSRLHPQDEGRVSRASRDRFALFLIGWLGGPQEYMRLHGHPRLRMRHAHVAVTVAMRDAWLRCMRLALAHDSVAPASRSFLDEKLSEVADFLQNQPE
jgi:hemoglobin